MTSVPDRLTENGAGLRRHRSAVFTAAALLAFATAGCGGGAPPAAAPRATAPSPATSTAGATAAAAASSSVPVPTHSGGGGPSAAAAMVCAPEAASDIYAVLRVRPTTTPVSTWAEPRFTCRYGYETGTMLLAVDDFADNAAAERYMTNARAQRPDHVDVKVDSQDAFKGADGTVLVRKDHLVLTVDVTGLPERFGLPPYPRSVVAVNVAAVIMGCWSEN